MAQPSPSLDLVAETIRHERELVVQHANSVDAKAGVVLGFAGAVTALASVGLNAWRIPGATTAAAAALWCLPLFKPQKYPAWRARGFRDRFLNAEPVFTKLRILDTEISMVDRATALLEANARRLDWSVRFLIGSVVLLTFGTIAEYLGR